MACSWFLSTLIVVGSGLRPTPTISRLKPQARCLIVKYVYICINKETLFLLLYTVTGVLNANTCKVKYKFLDRKLRQPLPYFTTLNLCDFQWHSLMSAKYAKVE